MEIERRRRVEMEVVARRQANIITYINYFFIGGGSGIRGVGIKW